MTDDFLNHDVARVFLQARYRDVVGLTYEREDWSHEDPTSAIAIAALAFVGRIDEAKTVLNLARKSPSFDVHQRIFASFYVATSLTRHGHYSEARKILSETFWLRHKMRAPKNSMTFRSEFFISQGLAFFRFIGGRFTQADRHAKHAIECAILAKFPYGRVLALDLQGHCLHHLGLHRESLQIMDDATRYAQKLGLSSLADNIMLQRELFITRFSTDLTPPRLRLEELTQQVRFQNSYSQSILFLELARVALLQGRVQHAKSLLVESSELNNVRGDRRLRIQHDLRLALAADMAGETEDARSLLYGVLEHCDPLMDIVFKIHALGHLAQLQADKAAPEELDLLTLRSGRYLAQRIADRCDIRKPSAKRRTKSHQLDSQDALGYELDRIVAKDAKHFKRLCAQGSAGIAVRAFEITQAGAQFMAIFEDTHEFLTFDQGDAVFQPVPLTELMVDVLKHIALGFGSLEALATQVWNAKDYHPLKHDPKIYRVLSKLRSHLGAASNWIKTTHSGYILLPNIKILMIHDDGRVEEIMATQTSEPLVVNNHTPSLTDRIYSYIVKKERVTNRDIVAEFHISSVTSARELTRLVSEKRLKRMGAGRSTTYICR